MRCLGISDKNISFLGFISVVPEMKVLSSFMKYLIKSSDFHQKTILREHFQKVQFFFQVKIVSVLKCMEGLPEVLRS